MKFINYVFTYLVFVAVFMAFFVLSAQKAFAQEIPLELPKFPASTGGSNCPMYPSGNYIYENREYILFINQSDQIILVATGTNSELLANCRFDGYPYQVQLAGFKYSTITNSFTPSLFRDSWYLEDNTWVNGSLYPFDPFLQYRLKESNHLQTVRTTQDLYYYGPDNFDGSLYGFSSNLNNRDLLMYKNMLPLNQFPEVETKTFTLEFRLPEEYGDIYYRITSDNRFYLDTDNESNIPPLSVPGFPIAFAEDTLIYISVDNSPYIKSPIENQLFLPTINTCDYIVFSNFILLNASGDLMCYNSSNPLLDSLIPPYPPIVFDIECSELGAFEVLCPVFEFFADVANEFIGFLHSSLRFIASIFIPDQTRIEFLFFQQNNRLNRQFDFDLEELETLSPPYSQTVPSITLDFMGQNELISQQVLQENITTIRDFTSLLLIFLNLSILFSVANAYFFNKPSE